MTSPLVVVSWNACSALRRIHDIQQIILEHSPDILAIQETHLTPAMQLKMTGYFTYRQDRPPHLSAHAAGGAALLVRKGVPHYPIRNYQRDGLEVARVAVNTHQPTIVASVYAQPGNALTADDILNIADSSPTIIVGDLNAKHPSWGSRARNKAGTQLMKLLKKFPLTISAPDGPTTCPYNRRAKPDILDVCVSSASLLPPECLLLDTLTSDHIPVMFRFSRTHLTLPQATMKINWDSYRLFLNATSSPPPPPPSSAPAVDLAIEALNADILSAAISSSTPRTASTKSPGIPSHIRSLRSERNQARKRWQTTGLPHYKTQYNTLCRKVSAAWQLHRSTAWHKFVETLDTTSTYSAFRVARALKNPLSPPHPLQPPNAPRMLTHPLHIATAFADHLQELYSPHAVSQQDLARINLPTIPPVSTPPETFHITDLDTVIHGLNPKKAAGHDRITNGHIKNMSPPSRFRLLDILNACLRLHYFPSTWKQSKVILIPKPRKNLAHPANYRPIHLLPSLSKVLERLLLLRLRQQLPDTLIPPQQMGFTCGHSTSHQIVRLIDDIISARQRGLSTIATFLDLSNAFDRVWHDGLLFKLSKSGIDFHLLETLRSFLSGRSFSTTITNHPSTLRPIGAGVPQGAVLSPTLYNIFTSDVPLHKNIKTYIYADDIAIAQTTQRRSPSSNPINSYLLQIHRFFIDWKLQVNPTKTVALYLPARPRPASIPTPVLVNGTPLPYQKSAKYLGVTFDQQLTMKLHTDNVTRSARTATAAISPLLRSKGISRKTKHHLVRACIVPVLTYASPAWAMASPYQHQKLENAYRKAFHIAEHAPWYASFQSVSDDLHLTPLSEILQTLNSKFFQIASSHANPLIRHFTRRPINHRNRKKFRPIQHCHQP